ncbi:outer membrane protein assembly factor BamE [Thalassobius sp. S69A]|uniref:outer membrane protein assembly factor BamE n=1 Tax=unclassified Thalassovita TaxID=2619711 RepID=UPI000C6B2076|nr:cell envelope protein SmpA [Paracoccaceae bacterium]
MSGMGSKLKTTIAAGVLLIAAGCSTQYRNHGYVPLEEDLANIVVGVDTRDSVAESVGTPSTGGILDDSGYYYVYSRVRHFGMFEPKVIEREVLAITFDTRGVVANIERFGLEDGNVVPLSRRVTSSSVANKSFLRQLLGNLGRFTASDFVE